MKNPDAVTYLLVAVRYLAMAASLSASVALAVPVTVDPGLFLSGPDGGDRRWYAVDMTSYNVWVWEANAPQTVEAVVDGPVDV